MECKNCGGNLQDDAGFCSYCGARFIDERISTKFLIKEFLDKVLDLDNKLLKTFWHLFTKPEEVINGYINGVRKRYYNPFSYLLISLTLGGIYIYFLKDIALETIANTTSQDSIENTDFMKNFITVFSDYQALFTISNVPIYGFISWLIFLNRKKYNFYEHLIIYLYGASHLTVISFLITIPVYYLNKDLVGPLALILAGATFLYFGYILIRLFKLSFFQFIIKSLYFAFLFPLISLLIGILMNLAMFLYMGPAYLDQFKPKSPIQKIDSVKEAQPLDSLKVIRQKDSLKKDSKAISFYDASSRLNCLS